MHTIDNTLLDRSKPQAYRKPRKNQKTAENLDTRCENGLFPPCACHKAPVAQLDRASDYESEG
jgi:hypothetical protein